MPLMDIPLMCPAVARALFRAGMHTPVAVAGAGVEAVETVLAAGRPPGLERPARGLAVKAVAGARVLLSRRVGAMRAAAAETLALVQATERSEDG